MAGGALAIWGGTTMICDRSSQDNRMRQTRTQKTISFLISLQAILTVSLTSQTFAMMAFDPANVSRSINLATGRTYLSYSDTPTYDTTTDTYHVPAVAGEEVSAPNPTAAANGDTADKPTIIGNPVDLTVPGPNLVDLGKGVWTNATPSSTLTDAVELIESGPPTLPSAIYDGRPFLDFYPSGFTPYAVPVGATDYSIRLTNGLVYKLIPKYQITDSSNCGNNFYPLGTYINGSDLCTVTEIVCPCTPGNPHAGKRYYSAFFFCCASSYNETLRGPDSPGGPPVVTSPGLADALADYLSAWQGNGLVDDFVQTAENGAPTLSDSGPTAEDIDNWKSQNQANVGRLISTGLGAGIGPDENRRCGDPGGQGP